METWRDRVQTSRETLADALDCIIDTCPNAQCSFGGCPTDPARFKSTCSEKQLALSAYRHPLTQNIEVGTLSQLLANQCMFTVFVEWPEYNG